MKKARRRDVNEQAADIVRRSTASKDETPVGVEAAWEDWSRRIQRVDQRTMTLLRAAFDAGVEAAGRAGASAFGMLGAKKGGDARAAKLSPRRKKQIAKKAALARWRRDPKASRADA